MEAEDDELFRVTTAPPGPAGPVSVTVPTDVAPPETSVGFTEIEAKPAGLIAKVPLWLEVPSVAVT